MVAFHYRGHVGELVMPRLAQGMTNRFPGERLSVMGGAATWSLSLRAAPKLSICPLGPNQRAVPAWKRGGTGSRGHACTVDTFFSLFSCYFSWLLSLFSQGLSSPLPSFLLHTKGSEWFSSGPGLSPGYMWQCVETNLVAPTRGGSVLAPVGGGQGCCSASFGHRMPHHKG